MIYTDYPGFREKNLPSQEAHWLNPPTFEATRYQCRLYGTKSWTRKRRTSVRLNNVKRRKRCWVQGKKVLHVKKKCSRETRCEWNFLPLKQLGTGVVWMEQKAKQGREERVLDWIILKQGRHAKNNQLTFWNSNSLFFSPPELKWTPCLLVRQTLWPCLSVWGSRKSKFVKQHI